MNIDPEKVTNSTLFQLCLELGAEYDCIVKEEVFLDKKATVFEDDIGEDGHNYWNVNEAHAATPMEVIQEVFEYNEAFPRLLVFLGKAATNKQHVTRVHISFMRIACDVADRARMLDWLQTKEEYDHPENNPALRIPLIGVS